MKTRYFDEACAIQPSEFSALHCNRLGHVHNAQKDCGHHMTFTQYNIPYHQSSNIYDSTTPFIQGHSTNLFLTLSVPQRNLAGWQSCRCFDELAGQFFAVEGLVLEVMMFCSIGSIYWWGKVNSIPPWHLGSPPPTEGSIWRLVPRPFWRTM